MTDTREHERLHDAHHGDIPWLRWGPYLSERQWGTVREDYSSDGNAWDYFGHDQARSRAYRWGEDGLAGFSDERQRLCFALALWNGADPILKERLFGVTNSEGNHGEDVKEYYFYRDATPTHSWLSWLYKYPQCAYPYADLVATNHGRSRAELEYELIDTGVLDEGRLFDVGVEYAKEGPDEVLVLITAHNRGPEPAELHLLPTLWFRNTWSWTDDLGRPDRNGGPLARPSLAACAGPAGTRCVHADHPELGPRWLVVEGDAPLLFTENETNLERLFGTPNASPFVKDGINAAVVDGRADAVNPAETGTKVAAHARAVIPAGGSMIVRLRLTALDPASPEAAGAWGGAPFGPSFEGTFANREREADEFYASITPPAVDAERAKVMRQALAGMIWTKQTYHIDIERWLAEQGPGPLTGVQAKRVRNAEWIHLLNDDVISMPDKWEYPWYAAWDLAFHTVALDDGRPRLRQGTARPAAPGSLPAPERPAARLRVELRRRQPTGPRLGDAVHVHLRPGARRHGRHGLPRARLPEAAAQLHLVGQPQGPDRPQRLPGRLPGPRQHRRLRSQRAAADRRTPRTGRRHRLDGALSPRTCSRSLSSSRPSARATMDMAVKFVEHFVWIAAAMDRMGDNEDELWDEEDGFFYDVLRLPDGSAHASQGAIDGRPAAAAAR